MLAAVQNGKHLGLQEVPKPVLVNDTDVIIKVTATAPCTSDVHAEYLPPSPPYVIGHEFVGIVKEVGKAVKLFKPGDRVAAPAYVYCGVCDICRKGITGLCPNGARFGSSESFGGNLPGALAEYVRAPRADVNLVKIPDGIKDEQAVFIGDMLATGYFSISNCNLKPGATVVVIGAGPVGLSSVHIARLYSPSKIILAGRRSNRLQAGLKMGATHIIDSDKVESASEIMKLTNGQGADAVVEAVGSPDSMVTACKVVGLGGTLSIIGFPPPGDIGIPMQSLAFKNVTINVGMSNQNEMQRLMGLMADGMLDVSPMLTHVMPFKEFDKAFKIFAKKEDNCIKMILIP